MTFSSTKPQHMYTALCLADRTVIFDPYCCNVYGEPCLWKKLISRKTHETEPHWLLSICISSCATSYFVPWGKMNSTGKTRRQSLIRTMHASSCTTIIENMWILSIVTVTYRVKIHPIALYPVSLIRIETCTATTVFGAKTWVTSLFLDVVM